MIERPEDLLVFGQGFGGSVTVDGQASEAIYSKGSDKERTIRGTVISDNRSFLIGVIPWAKPESRVEANGKQFVIEEIQEKAGLFSYYLKRHYERESEEDDSSDYPL
jgi:hypothetical protein